MTTQEKVKAIAEYDGFKFYPNKTNLFAEGYYRKSEFEIRLPNPFAPSELKYLTSLDWLHPVAMNVLDETTKVFNDTLDGDVFVPASDFQYNIKRACYIRAINGEYIDLFNAVYEGIIFLNQNKKDNDADSRTDLP